MVLVVKNLPASVGEVRDMDLIPQLENHGNPLSILAWRIPWTEESGGLQPIVLQRVGHDCPYNGHWGQFISGLQGQVRPTSFSREYHPLSERGTRLL